MYTLYYGTLNEAENGKLHCITFKTEIEALDFVDEVEAEVAELKYPNGKIWINKI